MQEYRATLLWSVAALSALIWTGCQTNDAPTSSGPGGATREELASLVQSAITAKDLDAMLSLYHWDGIDETSRKHQRTTVRGFFQGSVVDTEFLPLTPEVPSEFIRKGTLFRTNLPPEGHLRVRYGDDRTGPRTAVAFPYAIADGRYVLPAVRRVALDTSDPRNRQLSIIVKGDGPGGRVAFEASCGFMFGDEEREESLSSDRGTTRVFWGRYFTRCSVRKTSAGGWLAFRLLEGRTEILFDSEKIEDETAATWVLEAESRE